MGQREFFIASRWLIYNLMDLFFTHWGLQQGYVERNPVGHALITRFGEGWDYAFKMALALLLIPFIARVGKRYPSIWTYLRMWNVVICGVVLWNVVLVIGL